MSSFHILERCGFSLSLILSLQKRNFSIILGEYVEWEDADLKSLPCKHLCLKTNMKVIINERQKLIIQGKVYWIRRKELDAWFPNFQKDDQDDLSSDRESQEGDVANKADNNESDVDKVSKLSFMHENDTAHKDVNSCKKGEVGPHLEDHFNIYDNNDQEKNVEENIKDTTERVQSLQINSMIVVRTVDFHHNKLLIISDYAPQELNERRDLWDYLRTFIDRWEGDTVIMGDFNEVRSEHERNAMEISQKAKIRWSIEGDENSKYFHGIGVSLNVVAAAASLIGCSILTVPFNYLGVKVGSNMSRITSWDDVISKVPIYSLEFFYGVDGLDRKLALIGWNMVLTSKKNGGLSVSSFFAHNRAFLFKWVWRFLTDGSSMWTRFIKAIFGNKGALDTHKLIPRRSPWQDVILAIYSLQSKGEVALKVLYKRLYALEVCKSISVAEKMGHPSLSHSFRRMPRGGVKQENYGLLCSKVADLVLPNISDRWCWSLEGSQEFSVKSSRTLIDNTILPKAEVPTRWLKVVPIKKSVALWEFSTKVCSLIR
nr:RNA-directed DNA polymerase, eukaryota, reverse transcriptase zinc-binding domain protein [Tanacetum cinerariifolium]